MSKPWIKPGLYVATDIMYAFSKHQHLSFESWIKVGDIVLESWIEVGDIVLVVGREPPSGREERPDPDVGVHHSVVVINSSEKVCYVTESELVIKTVKIDEYHHFVRAHAGQKGKQTEK